MLLPRRVGAGLIDLAVVILSTAVAAAGVATRIPAIREPDGSVGFSPSDQQIISEMAGPFSRGHLIGDTLWAFSTFDVWVVITAAALAGLVVGVFVPRLSAGRSPGKFLLRMGVRTVDGKPAGLARLLVRTLAAVADLMPGVVPGLVGYAFAASNPQQQRIGDRMAGTVVVDTSLNRRHQPPDLSDDEAASPTQADFPFDDVPVGRSRLAGGPQTLGGSVEMKDGDTASDHTVPAVAPTRAQIPVEERSNNPYPKPVRRSREIKPEPAMPDFDSLTLPESSLSDMPLTNNALFEALGLSPSTEPIEEPESDPDRNRLPEAPDDDPVPAALRPKSTANPGSPPDTEPSRDIVPAPATGRLSDRHHGGDPPGVGPGARQASADLERGLGCLDLLGHDPRMLVPARRRERQLAAHGRRLRPRRRPAKDHPPVSTTPSQVCISW